MLGGVDASSYIAANVGSGTPQEFHDWVSYCNAPAGTISLADERATNGDKGPYNVKYWGVGNESWGCGGNMTGGEYATEYRKYISQFPVYLHPFFVATGPRGHTADGDVGWTEAFFGGLQNVRGLGVGVGGFALHYYTDFRQTAEDGAKFDMTGGHNFSRGLSTRSRHVRFRGPNERMRRSSRPTVGGPLFRREHTAKGSAARRAASHPV